MNVDKFIDLLIYELEKRVDAPRELSWENLRQLKKYRRGQVNSRSLQLLNATVEKLYETLELELENDRKVALDDFLP